jgi:electron transfer flavoprotein beta subunit
VKTQPFGPKINERKEKLEIIVLLKRVPATESLIEIAEDGASVKTDALKWVINPYDEFAVEEALRIREKHGGTVTILSAGPDKTVETIRTALAMGADKGVLINDAEVAERDGLGCAKLLAAAIKEMPFDLIISGMRAVDDDNFLVGPAVAEMLNIPNISMVTRQEIEDGRIKCHRDIEGGTMVIESSLPMLFTAQRGLNEPRYASLPGIMKAKKKPIETRTPADLGFSEAPSPVARILSLNKPAQREAGRIIEGESAQEKAAELVRVLREETKAI